MAFIKDTAFEARDTNGSRENLAHIAGRFQAEGVDADCSAGMLCVRNGRIPNEGFDNPTGTRVYNEYAWFMAAAGADATANTVIYACDTHDWPMIAGKNGNAYAVGTETLGLGAPEGAMVNYTRVDFDGQSVYRFGIGNLSESLGDNTYFTIADGGLLAPAAEKPATAGTPYFELAGTGNFVEGAGASFQYVDLMACVA